MLPAFAFLGGCLAVAAGVSLAPPSLRQQIAHFIAPSQTATAPVPRTAVESEAAINTGALSSEAPVTAQIVDAAEAPDAPPNVTVPVTDNLAPPVAVEEPGPPLAPQTPENASSAPAAAPVSEPKLSPGGGPPPRVAIGSADQLPIPRVPDAPPTPEFQIAVAGRSVEPSAIPAVEPAPERLPTVTPLPAPASVAAARFQEEPAQAAAAPTEAPPELAETPQAPPAAFEEPTLAIGEASRPAAGPPLRVAIPPRRPPLAAPSSETLAALTPAQPTEPEALAPTGPGRTRVLVHYPPSATAAAQAAAAALAGSGVAQAEVVPVQLTISQTNVRYYHPQDARTAQALATALSGTDAGLSAETRDFTDFRPRPATGTIEIWLAGDGPAPIRTAARPPQPAASAPRPAAQRADPQAVATDERQRLEREIQGLLLRQLQELQRR